MLTRQFTTSRTIFALLQADIAIRVLVSLLIWQPSDELITATISGLWLILLWWAASWEKCTRIVAHHATGREHILEKELGSVVVITPSTKKATACGSSSTLIDNTNLWLLPLLLRLWLWLSLLWLRLWLSIDDYSALNVRLTIAPCRDCNGLLLRDRAPRPMATQSHALAHTTGHALTLEELLSEGVIRLGHHFRMRRMR